MKAFGNIFIGAFCVVLLLGIAGSDTAYGQCKTYVECSAPTDENNPVCTTGSYDPCDNSVYWTLDFHRTSETFGNPTLRLRIIGTNIDESFESDDYSPNQDHSCNSGGWINVGPSSDHELRITRYGDTGHFSDIETTASYKAGSAS